MSRDSIARAYDAMTALIAGAGFAGGRGCVLVRRSLRGDPRSGRLPEGVDGVERPATVEQRFAIAVVAITSGKHLRGRAGGARPSAIAEHIGLDTFRNGDLAGRRSCRA